MKLLEWHKPGTKRYETGVDRGVLYVPDNLGVYATGVAWAGLTTVTESPSGAESSKQYADNIVYLNLVSAEEFAATIEAFTYPDEFGQFNGEAQPEPGVYIGQQNRKAFGLSYRSLIGNDLEGVDFGYKLHLVYGCLAAPSEVSRTTMNESPEAATLSWELSTTAVEVPNMRPSAHIVIDSTKVAPAGLTELEGILYGTAGSTDPVVAEVPARLPLPAEVIQIFADAAA